MMRRGASYIPSEATVKAFSEQNFGTVASPYVAAYVFRTGNVDKDFGMRRVVDGTFRIGDAEVAIDSDSNVFAQRKAYPGTRGLLELLTRKKLNQSFITNTDLKSYKEILEATHGHLENRDPAGVIKTIRGPKFKDIISKLSPWGGVTRRGSESSLGQKPRWMNY